MTLGGKQNVRAACPRNKLKFNFCFELYVTGLTSRQDTTILLILPTCSAEVMQTTVKQVQSI